MKLFEKTKESLAKISVKVMDVIDKYCPQLSIRLSKLWQDKDGIVDVPIIIIAILSWAILFVAYPILMLVYWTLMTYIVHLIGKITIKTDNLVSIVLDIAMLVSGPIATLYVLCKDRIDVIENDN